MYQDMLPHHAGRRQTVRLSTSDHPCAHPGVGGHSVAQGVGGPLPGALGDRPHPGADAPPLSHKERGLRPGRHNLRAASSSPCGTRWRSLSRFPLSLWERGSGGEVTSVASGRTRPHIQAAPTRSFASRNCLRDQRRPPDLPTRRDPWPGFPLSLWERRSGGGVYPPSEGEATAQSSITLT